MTQYSYQLSTSYAGLTTGNLESMSLPVPAPHHSLLVYSKPITTGDASVKGLGWRKTTWHWDFLTQAQYDKLRVYCSGLSAVVYINTRKNDGTYQVYKTTMIWPPEEPEYIGGKLLDITVEFRALAESTS
jgi:hypothetical protein